MIITISGPHGSGKTTVGKMLAERLGYKFFSTGDAREKIALKHGLTMNELNKIGEKEAWPHKEVDDYIKELGKKEDNLVIDSWLAFHFIPHSLKIFFKVDPRVGAERIFKQKKLDPNARKDETATKTVEEVMEDAKEKSESWRKGIKKWYGIDPFDPKNFDYTIDTSNLTPKEVAEKAMEIIKKHLS